MKRSHPAKYPVAAKIKFAMIPAAAINPMWDSGISEKEYMLYFFTTLEAFGFISKVKQAIQIKYPKENAAVIIGRKIPAGKDFFIKVGKNTPVEKGLFMYWWALNPNLCISHNFISILDSK